MSVVAILSSDTSREGELTILLHYLALFIAAYHSFPFTVSSVPDKANTVVDALSCFSNSGSWPTRQVVSCK